MTAPAPRHAALRRRAHGRAQGRDRRLVLRGRKARYLRPRRLGPAACHCRYAPPPRRRRTPQRVVLLAQQPQPCMESRALGRPRGARGRKLAPQRRSFLPAVSRRQAPVASCQLLSR